MLVYGILYNFGVHYSIETNKLENACYWVTECIISGYIFDLFEKIKIFCLTTAAAAAATTGAGEGLYDFFYEVSSTIKHIGS